jgi:hypothetical protein
VRKKAGKVCNEQDSDGPCRGLNSSGSIPPLAKDEAFGGKFLSRFLCLKTCQFLGDLDLESGIF